MRRTTREQLLHLLTEAAEFEHSLLCCYLYAAFSLKQPETLAGEESAAVKRWHKSIMAVAIEEMTHLALVANLTVAVGARPHFNRPNLPVPAGYHPAGIVIELAPFDMPTLEHFIFLERPHDAVLEDAAGFEQDEEYRRGHRPGVALMPAATDYETIAEFYATIRDTLTELAETLGERTLFCGAAEMQVAEDVVKLPGLSAITDVRSAVRAIDTIVVQGEGASSQTPDSHFARFESIKEEYERLLASNPTFQPAWPVARNPVMRAPVETDRVHISNPQAAAVLDVANALYNQMLRLLSQAYGRVDSATTRKRILVESAMQVMGVLRTVCELLVTLPANPACPGVNAGMSFTTLRATEPWCETPTEWATMGERLGELEAGLTHICSGIAPLEQASRQFGGIVQRFNGVLKNSPGGGV